MSLLRVWAVLGTGGDEFTLDGVDLESAAADAKVAALTQSGHKEASLASSFLCTADKRRLEPRKSLREQGVCLGDTLVLHAAGPSRYLVEAPVAAVHFWGALKSVDAVNDVFQLPSGVHWLGDGQSGPLFVRDCYVELWRQVEQQLDREQSTHDAWVAASSDMDAERSARMLPFCKVTIKGTPGIGKSIFALYAMWKARRRGMRVVFIRADRPCLVFNKDDTVHSCGSAIDLEMACVTHSSVEDRTTLLLVDGCSPPAGASVFTVLVTSPRKDAYWKFNKEPHSTLRYMPPFSESELIACSAACYSHLQQAAVLERFQRWGGVARMVLQHGNDAAVQGLLGAAIDTADVDSILCSIGNDAASDEVCHRLVHVQGIADSIVPFNRYRAVFASPFVAQAVAERWFLGQRERLAAFLCAAATDTALGTIRGILLEHYVDRRLRAGGSFRCRNLSDGSVSEVKLDPTEPCSFSRWEQVITVRENEYVLPVQKNLATLDALTVYPTRLYKITVGSSHVIKQSGLTKIVKRVEQVREGQRIDIVFVLPPDKFPGFNKQRYDPEGDPKIPFHPLGDDAEHVGSKRKAKRYHEIRQFALEMQIS